MEFSVYDPLERSNRIAVWVVTAPIKRSPSALNAPATCQNKHYKAKIENTPQGERRRRRKMQNEHDTATLENIRRVLTVDVSS